MRYFLLFLILIAVPGFSKDSGDTLLPRNSIHISLSELSLGVGVNYEKVIVPKKGLELHKAYNSFQAGINYSFLLDYGDIMPYVGIYRNWFLNKKNRISFYSGINGCALICLDPTPKSIRNYYDSIHFYGGHYVNPIEPLLIGDVGIKFVRNKFYLNVGIVSVFGYDRAYDSGFYVYPWAGIGIGFYLKGEKHE